ncbi:MAG: Na+/H+ antiporter NhaC family protein [Duncaniella sp.]|nr:Na+/H+ antiporter NhaC family protein [Duncaniella sp.]MDE6466357.1 Na+/H+ antiporter NhaC family protein [Duncaniella sp.]MDE6572362.1 Na+/H+ antiporter NhaC family protein [Duncaniella sp.]
MKGGPVELARISTLRGLLGLSPVVVFMLAYLAVSIVIGDFYKMPLSVAILVASIWGMVVYTGGGSLASRIETFSRAAAHPSVMYMVWIFIMAGAFASVAREIGAVDATVELTLRCFPARFIVPGLFVAACLISLSIGTSVGTVVALTPLAADIAGMSGDSLAFYVAVVLGGAFFGDNLSFISDTTIAATRSQGCKTADKFRANLWIALPAAIVTLVVYVLMSSGASQPVVEGHHSPWLVVPYVVVLVAAACGVNVMIVLLLGLVSALLLGILDGFSIISLFGAMGAGIGSMGDLIIVTLLASGMLGIIKAAGGIQYLLQCLSARVSGLRGAQGCIAVLVALVNLCTANNTVAIITVGGIAREICGRYGVDPRKSASLLDSCSCIVQCLIPYGAQTLLATSLAGIPPVAPFVYLYYPWALAAMVVLSILFLFPGSYSRKTAD